MRFLQDAIVKLKMKSKRADQNKVEWFIEIMHVGAKNSHWLRLGLQRRANLLAEPKLICSGSQNLKRTINVMFCSSEECGLLCWALKLGKYKWKNAVEVDSFFLNPQFWIFHCAQRLRWEVWQTLYLINPKHFTMRTTINIISKWYYTRTRVFSWSTLCILLLVLSQYAPLLLKRPL